jgi:hypothetical protein
VSCFFLCLHDTCGGIASYKRIIWCALVSKVPFDYITGPKANKRCVTTLWPCNLHYKGILRQKNNYGNSNISSMQKY